jgi:hypothetical protein
VITLSFNMSKCFGFHASIHYFFSSACMQGVQSCDIHIGPAAVSQLRPVAPICEISLSGLSNRLKRLLIQRFRSNDGDRISSKSQEAVVAASRERPKAPAMVQL